MILDSRQAAWGYAPEHALAQRKLELLRVFLESPRCRTVHDLGVSDLPDMLLACASYDAALLDLAIEKGARINARNSSGRTPLQVACMSVGQRGGGQAQAVAALLSRKADPNLTQDSDSRNALDRALEHVNISAVFALLADSRVDVSSQTFLFAGVRTYCACSRTFCVCTVKRRYNWDLLQLLIKKAGAFFNLEARDEDGNTALLLAVSADNPVCVVPLLKLGAKTDVRNNANEVLLLCFFLCC